MRCKKTIAFVLTLLLVILSLSGCGKEGKQSEKDNETGTPTVSKDGRIGDGKNDKFDLWCVMNPNTAEGMNSLNEHPAAKWIEDFTGVRVNYINPPQAQDKQTLNMLIGSNKIPDAVRYNLSSIYPGGIDAAIEDKVIIDATPLIKKYATNFMKIIESNPEISKDVYDDNGHIIGFGGAISAKYIWDKSFFGAFINKNYLDKTGMSVPETIEDWEKVLTEFRNQGIKYPYTWGANNNLNTSYSVFASAFGVPGNGQYYIDKDGKTVKYAALEDGFKQYITLMNKWYKEGILDKDFITRNTNKNIIPMMVNGEIGASVLHMTNMVSIHSQAKVNKKDVSIIGVPYPVLSKGDKNHFAHRVNKIDNSGIYISAKAKNPELIVKWIDSLYSEKGKELCVWGKEGDTYTVDSNGLKNPTDKIINNPDKTPAQARRQYTLRDLSLIGDDREQEMNYSVDEVHNTWNQWGKSDNASILPMSLRLTQEESNKFIPIQGELDSCVSEMVVRFIMGVKPMSEYNDFINTLKRLKVDEAIKIKQAAYDRYLKR